MSNPARPVTGTPIDTAWGLAVADSVVRVYPNAATRDADLAGVSSSELLGQAIVLTDTGSLLVYVGPVAGWRKPWNLPWGLLAPPVSSTLDVTGTATAQTVLSTKPTVDVLAGRAYRVSAVGTVAASAPGQLNIIAPGGTTIGRVFPIGSGEATMALLATWAQASTVLTSVCDLMVTGVGCNAKGSMAPHRMVVEDIGPSANPTALALDDAGALRIVPELLDDVSRAAWSDDELAELGA